MKRAVKLNSSALRALDLTTLDDDALMHVVSQVLAVRADLDQFLDRASGEALSRMLEELKGARANPDPKTD